MINFFYTIFNVLVVFKLLRLTDYAIIPDYICETQATALFLYSVADSFRCFCLMENEIHVGIAQQDSPEVPPLIKYISSNEVAGFDDMMLAHLTKDHCQPSESQSLSPSATVSVCIKQGDETEPICHHQRERYISISMPPSPVGVQLQKTRRVLFSGETIFKDGIADSSCVSKTNCSDPPKQLKHHSQPMPTSAANYQQSTKSFKDSRFDSFKTWSGKLERQISLLRGKPTEEAGPNEDTGRSREVERNLPVDRYFDALEGPELETLKVYALSFPNLSVHFLYSS